MNKNFSRLADKYASQDTRRVGWGSQTSQRLRFQALHRVIKSNKRNDKISILDIGCGLGAFYGYLQEHEFKGTYYGFDLLEKNIIEAKKIWRSDAFYVGDLLSPTIELPRADYIVASGIFFMPFAEWDEIVMHSLKKMYDLCRIGFATNFLSACSSNKSADSVYVDPSHIQNMITKITNSFMLAHDYLPNDFTVCAWRNLIVEESA